MAFGKCGKFLWMSSSFATLLLTSSRVSLPRHSVYPLVMIAHELGYVSEDGGVEMDPRKTARNYMCSMWFPIDLVTSIPFDWVQDSMSGDLTHLKLAKVRPVGA